MILILDQDQLELQIILQLKNLPLQLIQLLDFPYLHFILLLPLLEFFKINVRYDESAILIQQPSYFGKFLGLEASSIFEKALREDDIESLFVEPDRRFEEVGFDQIRRRVVNGYIDTVVLYARVKQMHQGRGPATNVKQGALSGSGHPIDDMCGFFETIMGPTVVQVLFAPEVLLTVPHGAGDAISWNEAITASRVVHDDLLAWAYLTRYNR